MAEKTTLQKFTGIRSELRTISDKYYSVQFSLNKMDPAYLFKLRYISGNGLCILVKQDSSVFKQLMVGDVVDMEYNRPESESDGTLLKTLIASKIPHNRYNGHSIVELAIIDG